MTGKEFRICNHGDSGFDADDGYIVEGDNLKFQAEFLFKEDADNFVKVKNGLAVIIDKPKTPKAIIDWLIMHHTDKANQLDAYADEQHDKGKIGDEVYNTYMEEIDMHLDSVNLFKKLGEALK